MKIDVGKSIERLCIHSKGDLVYKVNKEFLQLSCEKLKENKKLYFVQKNNFKKQRIEIDHILDNSSDAITKVNNKGEFTYLNKVAKDKMASYTSDFKTLNDKKQFEFFKYNDIEGKELSFKDTPIQRVLRGEVLDKYIVIGTSHLPITYHECSGNPIYDEFGNIEGGILIYKEIENSFKMDEYNAFKENIKDISLSYAILSYDDFKIKYINEYAFNTIQKSHDNSNSVLQLTGKFFFDYYGISGEKKIELIENIKKAIGQKESYIHKKGFIKEGKMKYFKTKFKPIFDKNNEIEKIVATGIDITDEEIKNIHMSDTLKSQEEMLINTSHELKTPLNLIFSAAQLLNIYLEKETIEKNKDEMLYSNNIIIQNCYRLTKLINNILDISNMESGNCHLNLTNNNIVDTIDDIVQLVSKHIDSNKTRIIFDTEVDELIIAVDIYKFERILLNLISNAIKFSNSSGVILIKLICKEDKLILSVKDEGIGINEKDLDLIFDKFTQVSKSLNRISEGTGVGLSLVKSLVELHGGKISVESTLKKGSIFKIELPIKTVDIDGTNSVENGNIIRNNHYHKSKDEMIKFELSDIYS